MMNIVRQGNNPVPFDSSSFLWKYTFGWVLPLFIRGYHRELEEDDLYDCSKEDTSDHLGDNLNKNWEKELLKQKNSKKYKASLKKAVMKTFGMSYVVFSFMCLFEECFTRVFQPVCLGWVVRYFSNPGSVTELECYLAAGGVCVLALFYVLTHHPLFFGMLRTGMKIRVACCTLIYKKSLKLSQSAIGKTTVGQMVNLLSNDVNRFDQSVIYLPYLIIGPLQAAIVAFILWQHLQEACLSGLAVLILLIPLQSFNGKIFSKLRSKTAALTDERVRLMNEIISGMQVIKMYAWETPFAKLVDQARRNEIEKIRGTSVLRGVNIALFFAASKIIVFICFITYVFMGHVLTAEIVFVSMSLYNNLRLSMTLFFPFAIAQWAESTISLQRIQKFLEHDEKTVSINHLQTDTSQEIIDSKLSKADEAVKMEMSQPGIVVKKVSARWTQESDEPTLKDLSFSLSPGDLLVVVGSVGSGKTSLLMTLLGELPTSIGEVKIRGKIAYASQEAWVFGGTVQQNVTFGQPMNKAKYHKVLHVCALDKDVEQLPYGDQTLVGERGVSLSGGQKARVNLARSLYLDADVYLLDDPLSAVDISVAKHLFDKCINGYLKNKVRVLVTHQIQFLKSASKILILKNGNCLALGSYDDLQNQGFDLSSMLDSESEVRRRSESLSSSNKEDIASISSDTHHELSRSNSMYESVTSLSNSVEEDLCKLGNKEAPRQADEERTEGSVGAKIYWDYTKAGGGCLIIFFLFLSNIVAQIVYTGSDYWLSMWTNSEEARFKVKPPENFTTESPVNITAYSTEDDTFYYEMFGFRMTLNTNLYIYTGLMIALFLLSLIRTTAFFVVCMNASVKLHNTMFECITRAPMVFFDQNPVGRILNRFTKDLGLIDDLLPFTYFDMITILLSLLGILAVVIAVSPWVSVPTVVLTIIFVFLRRFYIRTARDIKRLEGITRSPVFSHLATSLRGIATIRAFGVEDQFHKDFCSYQDHHTSSWFLLMATARWFGIVLDLLTVAYITSVTMFLLILNSDSTGGNVGLAISSALLLSGMFQWGVRQSAELESQMTAVERILEYSKIPSEAPLYSLPDKKPPPEWPSKGAITFENMSLCYSKTIPPVLKNLTCRIKAKEKVGIVGRTGAGKSSMITALFRMTEPEGLIIIDGYATKDIGLHDLRSKISIIPQDPVLFSGPVRRNIDPFGGTGDTDLWSVLEEVQLKEVIHELPGGLDTKLSEGGSNFSVGQRQLICLARAILRRNRILVLDEATANVDHRTDSLIQRTIRDKFSNCTVLTIAHRLNTIMDSDRVLVLDAGRILEFDDPFVLLQKPESVFADMVQQTGKAMSQQLFEVAQQAHENRRSRLGNDIDKTDSFNRSLPNVNYAYGSTNKRSSIEDTVKL